MGRRKLEKKKIENLQSRRVCFTKRRQGITKKAATLSKLYGIDTIFLTFSSAGKPYLSSTLPSSSAVDSVFEKIINDFIQSDRIAAIPSLSSSSSLQSQLNSENYNQGFSSVNQLFMGVDDVGSLSLSQLQSYKYALEQLKSEVWSTLDKKASQENAKGGSSISIGTGLPMLIDTDMNTDQTVIKSDNEIEHMVPMVFTDDKFCSDPTDQVYEGEDDIEQMICFDDLFDIVDTSFQSYEDSMDQAYESDNEFDLTNFVGDLVNADALDQTTIKSDNVEMIEVYSNYEEGNVNFDGILSLWDD